MKPEDSLIDEAEGIVEDICGTIEDEISEKVVLNNPDFFESIERKAKSILETIQSKRFATQAQLRALENMLAAVKAWVR